MQTTLFVGGICQFVTPMSPPNSDSLVKPPIPCRCLHPQFKQHYSTPTSMPSVSKCNHLIKIVIVTLHTATLTCLCSSQWVHLTTCKTAQTKRMLSSRHCCDHSSGSPHFWRVVDFWQCGSAIVAEFHWLVQAPNERSNPPLAARGLDCARFGSKTVKLKTFARSLLVRCDSREITVPTVCCCVILQTCWGMMDGNRWEMFRNRSKAKHPTVRDPETQALFMQSA